MLSGFDTFLREDELYVDHNVQMTIIKYEGGI